MEIKIPAPVWDHPIIDIIVDLEKLRTKLLGGDVPPYIFFQLKTIFQMLETLGSARIEGNNTTLAEYIENIIEKEGLENNKKNGQQELFNIDQSIKYIEESNLEELLINRKYLSDLHILVTQDLPPPPKGEGSNYPGQWRPHNVAIQNSKHVPVDSTILPEYMDEFIRFINTPYPEKNQLLMVAVAHHSFANIHPFDNGNGRLGRLLNYALLIKLGFQVKNGRLLNPSSVFYSDRDVYYNMLGKADSLEDNDMLDRCSYFLIGLKNEIVKIDTLLQKKYVVDKIILPALSQALERKYITDTEYIILKYIVQAREMTIKSEELEKVLGIKDSVKKSRYMNKLKEKNMIKPITDNGRIYTIHFTNNYLLRSIIAMLDKQGFVADFLNK